MRTTHIQTRSRQASLSAAFTLIELLLVLAILGTLMAMTVPNLMGRQETANVDVTQGSIAGVEQALQMYQLDHKGKLPVGREGPKPVGATAIARPTLARSLSRSHSGRCLGARV